MSQCLPLGGGHIQRVVVELDEAEGLEEQEVTVVVCKADADTFDPTSGTGQPGGLCR